MGLGWTRRRARSLAELALERDGGSGGTQGAQRELDPKAHSGPSHTSAGSWDPREDLAGIQAGLPCVCL